MHKLNKLQEKLAYQKQIGVSVIKGVKGSGKTSLALARMIYLLEHVCKKGQQVLFVSPNEETIERGRAYLKAYYEKQNLSLFDEERKNMVVLRSTKELMMEGAKKAFICYGRRIVSSYPENMLESAIDEVHKLYPRVRWLKKERSDFVLEELKWLYANHVRSYEDYVQMARKGATIKLPKHGNGRAALWHIKEKIEESMKREGIITPLHADSETLVYLKEDCLKPCYQHMIIDDAEQLTKVQLQMLHALWGQGEALFLFEPEAENALSYLNKGKGFKSVGFDMTGRTRRLTVVERKKAVKKKKVKAVELTPLEALLLELEASHQKAEKVGEKPALIKEEKIEKKKTSKLPWYIETYEFINTLTGVKTVFQKDSSAGETYIDEVRQEDVDILPIYSDIAAGMPIEIVDEVSGEFEIPAELFHHKKNSYMLQVQGDSMIGVDILDGDYVVIQAGNVQDHEIAAVYYNGATTLKRIVQEEDHVLLVSENPKYHPMVIEDGDFRVMGKLVGIIKSIM